MIRITIDSASIHVKKGVSQKTGKPYEIREQPAWLHTGAKYPVACRIPLQDGQEPYPLGEYEVTTPLSVGRFESLMVSRDLGLRLIKASAAKVA